MQITFLGQESQFKKTAKGGYSQMEISYVDERGGNKTWKIMSFGNPKVFDTFKSAKEGEVYEITTRKNDRDFTEWAAAERVDGTSAKPAAAKSTPVVSQYETRDERNTRQRLIVRQSCLAQAVTLALKLDTPPHETQPILDLADEFVAWVFEAPGLMEDNQSVS